MVDQPNTSRQTRRKIRLGMSEKTRSSTPQTTRPTKKTKHMKRFRTPPRAPNRRVKKEQTGRKHGGEGRLIFVVD